VALKATEKLTVVLDVQWINYSAVASVGNALLPNLMQAPLGDDGGRASSGGHDDHQGRSAVRRRRWLDAAGGLLLWAQPIPSQAALINILAPGVIEHHLSAGFSKTVRDRHGIHLGITRALSTTLTGPNVLEAPGQQSIELTMDQWICRSATASASEDGRKERAPCMISRGGDS